MPLGHDLAALAQLINERTRLVFVANPNNPTGTWVNADALRRFVAGVPEQTLVVVDEAYIEYVSEPDFPDASRWLGEFPNLIVTRTFSKVYGRRGCASATLSHPSVADMLNRVRQPFNVNSIALAAALAALDDNEHLKRSVETNRAGMAQLRAGFDALGVRHLPSAGNFVMIDCGRPAPPVYEAMLREMIVRPVGNYGLPNHLRITIGTREQNERLLAALKQALLQRPSIGSSRLTTLPAPSACRATNRSHRAHARRHRRGHPGSARIPRKRRPSRDDARDARTGRADRADERTRNSRARRRSRWSQGRAHPLDMGNSGTAMRLMTGLLAGQSFDSELIGDSSLMAFGVRRDAALRQMGARIDTASGKPPVRIRGGQSLSGIRYELPVASAQVKSAVLLAGLYAQGQTTVIDPPSRAITPSACCSASAAASMRRTAKSA